jgi:hypothetical protein
MTPSIFIQIASYRDPLLVSTVRDAIAKSSGRNKLIFGICHQHGIEDSNLPFTGTNFRIDKVPYQESRGACWARNRIQQLYDGETYTLHLDSHHRFAPGWDQQLVEMLATLDVDKPLLTGYLPAFDPDDNTLSEPKPSTLAVDSFGHDGALTFHARIEQGIINKPIPARFYSGHFCFGPGAFAVEVQHDPEFYFIGEEISLSVRAFTHGYDLFHPHQPMIWHEYTRKNRPKHWEDHTDNNKLVVNWQESDTSSKERNRILLGMEDIPSITPTLNQYGLGSVRSLRDYERYAGIHFASRSIEAQTRDNFPPPGTDAQLSEAVWLQSLLKEHIITAHLNEEIIDLNAAYEKWSISLLNEAHGVIHSEVLTGDSITSILADSNLRFNISCFTQESPRILLLEPSDVNGKKSQPIALAID